MGTVSYVPDVSLSNLYALILNLIKDDFILPTNGDKETAGYTTSSELTRRGSSSIVRTKGLRGKGKDG